MASTRIKANFPTPTIANAATVTTIRKVPAFQKCQRLVSRYALALERVQQSMFEEYGQTEEQRLFFDDGFYNVNNLEVTHKPMCVAFANCHERYEAPQIEEMTQAWHQIVDALRTPKYHALCTDFQSMLDCNFLMKTIVGFCFLEAKYYEAIHSAWALLRLTKFHDPNLWMLCLSWALRLEDWQLLGHLLELEARAVMRRYSGYALCLDCVRLVHRLGTSTTEAEQSELIERLAQKLDQIWANDEHTFCYCQAKSMLCRAMVMASRMANADLQRIDDPVFKRQLEMSYCRTALTSHLPGYFKSGTPSSIQAIMGEDFVRFASNFADYMESAMVYVWDCWTAGMSREAESTCLTLWRLNLAFGSPYWALRPLALLLHIKSNQSMDAHLLPQFVSCVQAMLTPKTATSSYYLHTPKRAIRPSVFRRGSAVDDSFDLAGRSSRGGGGEEEQNSVLDELLALEMSSMNICRERGEKRQKFRLEPHVLDCACAFCMARTGNWAMAMELEWVKLLFSRMASKQFALFQQALDEIAQEMIQPLRERLCAAIFAESGPVPVQAVLPARGMPQIGQNQVEMARETPIETPTAPKRRGRPPKQKPPEPVPMPKVQQQTPSTRAVPREAALASSSSKATAPNGGTSTREQAGQTQMVPATGCQSLPPHFVHLWASTVGQLFLQKGPRKRPPLECLQKAMEMCASCSPLSHRAEWLLLRHLARAVESPTTAARVGQFREAQQDLRHFGHLFFREWRQRCATFLARSALCLARSTSSPNNAWLPAFYQLESAVPSTRQLARTSYSKRAAIFRQIDAALGAPHQQQSSPLNDSGSAPVLPAFAFHNTAELRRCVDRLPVDMTLVSLQLDELGTLWLARCHALHDPIVLRLCQIDQADHLLLRMQQLLVATAASVHKWMRPRGDGEEDNDMDDTFLNALEPEERAKHREQEEQWRVKCFWQERMALDGEMKQFCAQLQADWLGTAAPLLLPLNSSTDRLTKVADRMAQVGIFTRPSAMTMMHLMDRLDERECLELAQLLQRNDPPPKPKPGQKARTLGSLNWTELRQQTAGGRAERNAERRYTLLTVPPALSHLPWECLPIFVERAPLVTRIPSLHFFEHLLRQQHGQAIPQPLDGRNSFYLLNPDGDLAKTQERLKDYIERFEWRGLSGKAPSHEQLLSVLTQHDLFLYIGHGSGARYFGRSTVRESDCRAVSILMGCSSVRIVEEGPGMDGRSLIYDYLIARCPCVIGCLWLVTDGEIDRFFMALMDYCFAELARRKSVNDDEDSEEVPERGGGGDEALSLKLLAEGMVMARSRCKLPYLTGASVVAYGLPVAALSRGGGGVRH